MFKKIHISILKINSKNQYEPSNIHKIPEHQYEPSNIHKIPKQKGKSYITLQESSSSFAFHLHPSMGASPFCEPTRILSFPSKAEVTEPSSFSLSSWELRSQTEPLTENPLASHSFRLVIIQALVGHNPGF